MSFFLSTKRVFRYGFIGFMRSGFMSLAAILIMSITLFTLASLLILGASMHAALNSLKDKVDITVYFTTAATEEQMQLLQQSVQSLPEVSSVAFVSRDQALAAFRMRHKDDALTLQALEELGDNPLGASIDIRAKDPSQYEAIAKFLTAQQQNAASSGGAGSAIDKINFFQNKSAIDRLSAFIALTQRIGVGIALFFGIASILIAFNTIRLIIYVSRDEIRVMNLVGASSWYVRGPFMIAGVLYGFISGAIVMLILFPITKALGPGSQAFLSDFNVYDYFLLEWPSIAALVMACGIFLGSFSSFLSVRRYLYQSI